jgi:hypothetical protein
MQQCNNNAFVNKPFGESVVQPFFCCVVSNELGEQRIAILLTLDGSPSGRQLSRSYLVGIAFWVASKSHN